MNKEIKLYSENLKLEIEYPLRALFLSDMHCGSTHSIQPSKFKMRDGGIREANELQEEILNHWNKIINIANEYRIQYIFCLGDLFHGLNPIGKGEGITCHMEDQIRMAAKLLSDFGNKVIFYILSGTRYHEIPAGMGEPHNHLASILSSKYDIKAYFIGSSTYVRLENLPKENRLFLAHEASSSINPAGILGRDISWALESAAIHKSLPINAIIRAHKHSFVHLYQSGIHAIQLPCWIAWDSFKGSDKNFFKWQPDFGAVMMLVDKYGDLRFQEYLIEGEDRRKITELSVKEVRTSKDIHLSEVHPRTRAVQGGMEYLSKMWR